MSNKHTNFSILKVPSYPILGTEQVKFLHYQPEMEALTSYKPILEDCIEFTPTDETLLDITDSESLEEAVETIMDEEYGHTEENLEEIMYEQGTLRNYIYTLPRLDTSANLYILLVRVGRGKYFPVMQSTNRSLILHYINHIDLDAFMFKINFIIKNHPELVTTKQQITEVFEFDKEFQLNQIETFL